jgi:IS30 family transposase
VQHRNNKKEQLRFGKIVSEEPLTINQIISMLHKHLTPEQKNELSALLRAKVKKKDIAKCLGKHRTTIWRELQRNSSENGKYYARKAKRLTKERRIKANKRFKKLESGRYP